MKILITGSSGYVGNFLAEHFARLGREVVGCDLSMLPRQAGIAGFRFRRLDVTDADAVLAAFKEEKPEVVVHLAYLMDPQHDAAFEKRVDVDGSMHVLAACDAVASVRQLLLFSSTSAYGANESNPLFMDETRPLHPNDYVYGIHKKTVEERYRAEKSRSDLKLVIVRMCTALGPSYYKPGGVVATFTKAPFALLVDGQDMKVQWIHEDDVKNLIALLVDDREAEDTFNLVPDTYTSIGEMAKAQGKRTVPVPAWMLQAIFGLLWSLRIASNAPSMVRLMTYGIVASPEKLKKRYGYTFKMSSLDAFLDAVEKRKANGTLKV